MNAPRNFFFLPLLVETTSSAQPHMDYMCRLSLRLCKAEQDPAVSLAGTLMRCYTLIRFHGNRSLTVSFISTEVLFFSPRERYFEVLIHIEYKILSLFFFFIRTFPVWLSHLYFSSQSSSRCPCPLASPSLCLPASAAASCYSAPFWQQCKPGRCDKSGQNRPNQTKVFHLIDSWPGGFMWT